MSTEIALPLTLKTVGKWLYKTLMDNEAVAAIVGTKVFPYMTQEPQNLPWIVWDNMDITYEGTKDGTQALESSCTIVCAAKSVDASYSLADAVVGALNDIDGCRVIRISGLYDESVGFLQEISINIDLY